MMRGIGGLAAGLTGLILGGCGDREGAEQAALALSDAIYPGEFELHDSYMLGDHYDVSLQKRDDPLVRVRFSVDAKPADCGLGTACEQRFRRAHGEALARGFQMRAFNQAFDGCGVAVLGLHDAATAAAFRPVVELDLDPANQQPTLDSLTPCIAAYRQALAAAADAAQRTLALRILRPVPGRPATSAPLTPDSQVSDDRASEPSYQISIAPDRERAMAADLQLYPNYLRHSGLNDKLAEATRRALTDDPQGGQLPPTPTSWRVKLDPDRLDAVHAYVLACSTGRAGGGPCRTDMAVRMRYDLATGQASELAILRDIRDASGAVALPELPGR